MKSYARRRKRQVRLNFEGLAGLGLGSLEGPISEELRFCSKSLGTASGGSEGGQRHDLIFRKIVPMGRLDHTEAGVEAAGEMEAVGDGAWALGLMGEWNGEKWADYEAWGPK